MAKKNSKGKGLSLRVYKNTIEIMAKASRTFHELLEENKRLGIATPFSLGRNIYYLMPDGRILLKK